MCLQLRSSTIDIVLVNISKIMPLPLISKAIQAHQGMQCLEQHLLLIGSLMAPDSSDIEVRDLP